VRVLPLLILGTIVMFMSGLIAPERSKRLQGWVDGRLQKVKKKGERNAGWVGDWTAKSFRAGQRINTAAVRTGRRLRKKLPF
jgi:hypothetical protein